MNKVYPVTKRSLSRDHYLGIVRAALMVKHCQFAREVVLRWLANYPGDLEAGLYYAQLLLCEDRHQQALLVLDGLCMADPEFVEAVDRLTLIEGWALAPETTRSGVDDNIRMSLSSGDPPPTGLGRMSGVDRLTYIYALTGRYSNRKTLAPWGSHLRLARQAMEQGNLEQAQVFLQKGLGGQEPHPLACMTHLSLLELNPKIPLQAKLEFAERYNQLWMDCIPCMLYLAIWLMETGESERAVALLHQVAARDVGGQVVRRMWGEEHSYHSLWPKQLELDLNLPIPSEVAAILGWNRLPQGEAMSTPRGGGLVDETLNVNSSLDVTESSIFKGAPMGEGSSSREEQIKTHRPPASVLGPTRYIELPEELRSGDNKQVHISELEVSEKPSIQSDELHSIRDELERYATRRGLAGVTNLDGRFPVYIVFSARSRLDAVYGQKVADLLETEMVHLVKTIGKWRRWNSRLFFADDPTFTNPLGIKPAKPDDPWQLKLALVDLDAALAQRGERIGALLIVGGPEIVPFHHLPNPIDDQDEDVPTDNPYSTRDENYFVPEWPVGRLPGGSGKDARFLIEALNHISEWHEEKTQHETWFRHWLKRILAWWKALRERRGSNFGYSAAIWRRAARSVFRPIGKPEMVLVSPPLGLCQLEFESHLSRSDEEHKEANGVPLLEGKLGYFNLHGLVDAPEWYGQRDPLEPAEGPDYPVALRPQDILQQASSEKGIPQVIFSAACYGLHIQDRQLEDAMSLRFLEAGSLAVIGSTCMAYGSIGIPLIAADLLGLYFWRFIQQGLPAGEALRQAKVQLASEMHRRQGFLDGEDQKTLISFVLYGDPLAQAVGNGRAPKSVRYLTKPLAEVRTVCDRVDCPVITQPVPAEVMASVKRVVAQYLPGMSDARLAFAPERERCGSDGQCCATSQGVEVGSLESGLRDLGAMLRIKKSRQNGKTHTDQAASRRLVTLSKQVERIEGVHPLYARLTLDKEGKLVKLVVSR